MEAIAPIDQQAKDIITQVRRNFPTGKVSSPEDLPAPPKELESLQQQKDSVVLQFRAELQVDWAMKNLTNLISLRAKK